VYGRREPKKRSEQDLTEGLVISDVNRARGEKLITNFILFEPTSKKELPNIQSVGREKGGGWMRKKV